MMFYKVRCIILSFITIFYCVKGDTLIKINQKRHSVTDNYQLCLESFDIHSDKIIKTQDSIAMGAAYLTSLNADSRSDCLRYCCETDRCDVFIFEEKKSGGCYLFQCGPLHDFKCKFTRHANYTSAVRTSYPATEEEIRISQQEHELKSLRKNSDITSDYGFTEAPIKSVITQIPKLPLTTPAPIKPACSRNQYECRSSGECIAIYNVCDGIPQCSDGSDEAADLICPTEKPTVSSMIQTPRLPANVLRYQQMLDERKPSYPATPEINSKTWQLPNIARQISQPQNLYPGQQAEIPQIHNNFRSSGYQWNYQPIYEQNKDPYSPANSFHEQNLNPYEQQPHIFNHKGPSVIGDNEADRNPYMDSKHPYTSHFPSSNKGSWQDNQAQLPSNTQYKQINPIIENPIKSTTPPCDTPEEHKNDLIQNKESNEKGEKAETHVKENKQVTEKQSLSVPDVNKHNHLKNSKDHKKLISEEHSKEHEKTNIVSERILLIENEVLRPRGARVSLSLGLIATAITAALIICRLRVVKRRGRYGHGPYAHDADYLVNGMYL